MKYIIEIENEPFGRNDDPVIPHGMDKLYRAKGFKSLVFDKNGLDKLIPYTEPDREAIEDEVWELVRIITDMAETQRKECFGGATCNLDEYMTYKEAKAQYEAWLKQKEIHVGDEVTSEYGDGVVLDICENVIHILGKDGFWNEYTEGEYAKTGRHFDEVEELLKKMRGDKE